MKSNHLTPAIRDRKSPARNRSLLPVKSGWMGLKLWEIILCAIVIIGCVAMHVPSVYEGAGTPLHIILALISYASPVSGILYLSAVQVIPDLPGKGVGLESTSAISAAQLAIVGYLPWLLRGVSPKARSSCWTFLKAVGPFYLWNSAMALIQSNPWVVLLMTFALITALLAVLLADRGSDRLAACLLAFLIGQFVSGTLFWIIKMHLGDVVQAFDIEYYGDSRVPGARIGTSRGNADALGVQMVMVIVGALWFWLARTSNQLSRAKMPIILIIMLVIGSVLPLIGSGCRGAFMSILFGMGFLLFSAMAQSSNPGLLVQRSASLAIIMILAAAAFIFSRSSFDLDSHLDEMAQRQAEQSEETGSVLGGRNREWTAAGNAILDSPLVGGGKVVMLSYVGQEDKWAAHSTYLDVGLVGGIPGMLLFIGFVFRPFFLLWRHRHIGVNEGLLVVYFVITIAIGNTSALQTKQMWIFWGMMAGCITQSSLYRLPKANRGLARA